MSNDWIYISSYALLLQIAGYYVDEAKNLRECLKILDEDKGDIRLVIIVVKHIDETDLATDPVCCIREYRQLPVILIQLPLIIIHTGHSVENLSFGAEDCPGKKNFDDQFCNTIKNILGEPLIEEDKKEYT